MSAPSLHRAASSCQPSLPLPSSRSCPIETENESALVRLLSLLWPSAKSLNSVLDEIWLGPFSVYDLLTALEVAAFHAAFYLCLAPSWIWRPRASALMFVAQLACTGAAYRWLSAYVDKKEGSRRGLWRFSLLPRPNPGDDITSLVGPSSPPHRHENAVQARDGHLTASPEHARFVAQGEGVFEPRAVQKHKLITNSVNDTGSDGTSIAPAAAAASPTSHVLSPITKGRRLSAADTIAAIKRPLLHADPAHKLSAFQSLQLQKINPFVNKTWKINEHEHIRLSFAVAFLLPFRLVIFLTGFLGAALYCKLLIIGVPLESIKTKPLPSWRRRMLPFVRYLIRFALLGWGYLYIGTRGKKATTKEAPIIIANHIGFVEPIVLLAEYLPSPVGQEENLTLPIIGAIAQAFQSVPVRRKERASRARLVEIMKERCSNPAWPQILIFPEGTTTNGHALITFKNGAFIPGAPVQPVAVRIPSGSRISPAWVSCGPHPLIILLRLLCEPFSRAYFDFLPVYRPNAAEKANPTLFAANVRSVIARSLQVAVTQHSYEDALLAEAAWASPLYRSLPDFDSRATTSLELSALQNVFNLDAPSALLHLDKFSSMDTEGKGYINYQQLCVGLGVRDSPEMLNLFDAMDEDDRGEIDFREYVIGLGMIEKAGDTDRNAEAARLRLLCRLLDTHSTGRITTKHLLDVMSRAEAQSSDSQVMLFESDLRSLSAVSEGDKSSAETTGRSGVSNHIVSTETPRDAYTRESDADGYINYEQLQSLLIKHSQVYECIRSAVFSALPLPTTPALSKSVSADTGRYKINRHRLLPFKLASSNNAYLNGQSCSRDWKN